LSVGIAKQLKSPDDSFVLSNAVSFQYYDLNNYNTGLFTFGDGSSRNLAYTVGLSRNNKGLNPIFPTYGSEFNISAKFTPPYSLMNGVDYANLGNQEAYKLRYSGTQRLSSTTGPDGKEIENGDYIRETYKDSNLYEKVLDYSEADADQAKVDQKKFNWLEYYKVKFKADWYTKVYRKLTLRTLGEFGFLGSYNKDRGLVPFERFFVGGDGLANFALDGREVIGLRGYPNQSLTPQDSEGDQNGATIYNKFSLELRYPITLKAAASIYALTFLEAGGAYDKSINYNPFALSRSAGAGLRVFMPAFGLLGIDFGYGFDPVPNNVGITTPSGWQTHFIIGQQF
jgi:outer membrane protein insertion porin family